jgi:hypothetical protein
VVVVRWFFLVGGFAFMLAALYLRERPSEAAHITALTFGLIGFFWTVPQLVLMASKKWRA